MSLSQKAGEAVWRVFPFVGLQYNITYDEWGLFLRWPVRLRLLRHVPYRWRWRLWGIV